MCYRENKSDAVGFPSSTLADVVHTSQQTRDVDPTLFYCRASVVDGGPTSSDDFKLKKTFGFPWLIKTYFSVVRVRAVGETGPKREQPEKDETVRISGNGKWDYPLASLIARKWKLLVTASLVWDKSCRHMMYDLTLIRFTVEHRINKSHVSYINSRWALTRGTGRISQGLWRIKREACV